MTERPYVLLSCAVSLDGCIDDSSDVRLMLSNAGDVERVDEVRADCDAIMVGASTVRRDNPRLLVRSAELTRRRVERGLPPSPVKVTLTTSGDLDPASNFFTAAGPHPGRGPGPGPDPGPGPGKIVYTTADALRKTADRLAGLADVVPAGDPLDLALVLGDLARRGIGRLMVEGGTSLHTQFLTTGLADELHLVVAPFLVGDPDAPRFVGPGRFAHDAGHRARLAGTRVIGDCVLLRYALSDRYPPPEPS